MPESKEKTTTKAPVDNVIFGALPGFFKCILKSSDKVPAFYSPSTSTNHDMGDGYELIVFDDEATTTKPPRSIVKCSKAFETYDPTAYCLLKPELKKDGVPAILSIAQFEKITASFAEFKASQESVSIQDS